MDFITGALPNVMFIAGLIAMGIGLGIEFKIVEIKGELSKAGRLGALGTGAVLMLLSIYLYTRPPQATSLPATVAGAPPAVAQANTGGLVSAAQPAPAQSGQVQVTTPVPPTATAAPPTATTVPPTATPVPPTKVPAPTAAPGVKVPDIRGQNVKDAQQTLAAAGLRLGEHRERCEDIGASEAGGKLKKGQVQCQSPAPGSVVAPNTLVRFVLLGG